MPPAPEVLAWESIRVGNVIWQRHSEGASGSRHSFAVVGRLGDELILMSFITTPKEIHRGSPHVVPLRGRGLDHPAIPRDCLVVATEIHVLSCSEFFRQWRCVDPYLPDRLAIQVDPSKVLALDVIRSICSKIVNSNLVVKKYQNAVQISLDSL